MNRRHALKAGFGVVTTSELGTEWAVRGVGTSGPIDERWKAQILAFDGADDLDVFGTLAVLEYAARLTDRVHVQLATMPGVSAVTLTSGTEVAVKSALAPGAADLLVVPGGGYGMPAGSPGVPAEILSGKLPAALSAAHGNGVTIASVCTGAMLLSAAGITRNRPCTTHHRSIPDLEREGGVITRARVVDDGDLITAGGVTSGIDLALWLVERELGSAAALSIERMLEHERRGTVWRRN